MNLPSSSDDTIARANCSGTLERIVEFATHFGSVGLSGYDRRRENDGHDGESIENLHDEHLNDICVDLILKLSPRRRMLDILSG